MLHVSLCLISSCCTSYFHYFLLHHCFSLCFSFSHATSQSYLQGVQLHLSHTSQHFLLYAFSHVSYCFLQIIADISSSAFSILCLPSACRVAVNSSIPCWSGWSCLQFHLGLVLSPSIVNISYYWILVCTFESWFRHKNIIISCNTNVLLPGFLSRLQLLPITCVLSGWVGRL